MPHWGASSEFRVSAWGGGGEEILKSLHYDILRVFLRHTCLLSVEIRYTRASLSPPLGNSWIRHQWRSDTSRPHLRQQLVWAPGQGLRWLLLPGWPWLALAGLFNPPPCLRGARYATVRHRPKSVLKQKPIGYTKISVGSKAQKKTKLLNPWRMYFYKCRSHILEKCIDHKFSNFMCRLVHNYEDCTLCRCLRITSTAVCIVIIIRCVTLSVSVSYFISFVLL